MTACGRSKSAQACYETLQPTRFGSLYCRRGSRRRSLTWQAQKKPLERTFKHVWLPYRLDPDWGSAPIPGILRFGGTSGAFRFLGNLSGFAPIILFASSEDRALRGRNPSAAAGELNGRGRSFGSALTLPMYLKEPEVPLMRKIHRPIHPTPPSIQLTRPAPSHRTLVAPTRFPVPLGCNSDLFLITFGNMIYEAKG
jgi:hypothetical protein